MFKVPLGGRVLAAAVIAFLAFVRPTAAQDILCDPATRDQFGRDCRDILIQHIRQENVRLDVAFWFMEDAWMAQEVIKRFQAGVPVRVLMDTEANAPNPRNIDRLAELKAAGIPMRERIATGILHWKMMLFAGQGIVEFSGANYSSDAWTVSGPDYTNYVDESIYFTSKDSIVNSFRTKFDELWINTQQYRDYANITVPLTRAYDIYPIDPDLNFVPDEPHAGRAIGEYEKETQKIDVIMYRITDSRYADAMIAAEARGIPVRLITEPLQYRDPIRQYHSWNIDRMYMAGIEIRSRSHAGLNHQKSVLLYDQGMTIFGSSNWSPASSDYQEEHNLFTKDPTVFQWFVDQFERKWTNGTGIEETAPFVPLPPDAPKGPSPASSSTGVPTTGVKLQWNGGYWAHKYDVYLGTSPANLTLVRANVPRATSGDDLNALTLSETLIAGTTYYWQVVGKTAADMPAQSPVWTFTTAGVAPPSTSVTLAREPYLQQVTTSGAIVVWATREEGSAQLKVMGPTGSMKTVGAVSTLYSAGSTGMAADYYQHVARVTGLNAATTYTYDIIVDGTDLNPATDTFTTAPSSANSTVTFVAFGDSGIGSVAQQQIAARLASESFDLALHGGDIAYANSSGTGAASHQTMHDWFFVMYQEWLRRSPVFPSMGNHDSRTANEDGRPYLDLFVLPTTAATAQFPDHAERYYSFDYGPMHVIVLDTELAFLDPARRAAQLAWAAADLAGTNKPWKVALFHRPGYSAGGEHGSDLEIRQVFGDLFDDHDVQLAISAHEHDYERTVPLRAGVNDPAGTVYVVTGGGGGPLYPAATDTWTAHSASVYHYVRGTATECTLRLDAIGVDGASFDGVTLQRCAPTPDVQAPQVSITSPATGAKVRGAVNVSAAATDDIGVTAVELLVDGSVVGRDTQAPFSVSWDTTSTTNGAHVLTARAADAAGNTATSDPISVVVDNGTAGTGDIVLYAADAAVIRGRWQKEADPTAAAGIKIRNPDAGAAKRVNPLADPVDYFELTFTAEPGVPYRFWMRGKADGDSYPNDSVFVQFTGTADYRIGTTSATEYNLEDCGGCRISGWGWQDNAWGVGVPSEPITFTTAGPHRMRIQVREDGLSIDQVMLSPVRFFSTSPGALKNDATIYPRSAGGPVPDPDPEPDPDPDPEPTPNTPPTVTLTAPASGATATAPATISLAASASDSDGTVVRVDFYRGTTLIGSDTSSPYTATWSSVAKGSYTLTAKATDDDGATTTSGAVTITVTDPLPSDPDPIPGVPAPWTAQDIGAVGLAGSASSSGGTFTITGEGVDIWNAADAFHYVWQPLSGDADIVARVTSIEYVHAWVKAGVMIRERLTADSPHALMLVSPGKGLAFQRRVAAGGVSTSTSGGAGTAPAWVKLERRGNTIKAYRSSNGTSWTLVDTDTFTMGPNVHIGLVVSSHVAGRLATATFDSVVVTPVGSTTPADNAAPTVSLTGPVGGATFTAPATIAFAATAADSDGSVARVDFYAGSTLIGSDSSSPYAATWNGAPAGTHTLTAKATDDDGAVTTSAPVTVTVKAAPEPVPSLPAPWTSEDVGSVGLAGRASAKDGVFTVTGEGIDIWNAADAFHYVWQPLSGDADVVARVDSIEYVHAWVKAGVMIRQTLAADSPHALMLVSPGKGVAFQRRVAAAGVSTSTSGGPATAPAWVRLERRGSTIRAYVSTNGTSWTLVGSDTFTMSGDVHVGLAVSSHVNGRLATATFSNVSVTPR